MAVTAVGLVAAVSGPKLTQQPIIEHGDMSVPAYLAGAVTFVGKSSFGVLVDRSWPVTGSPAVGLWSARVTAPDGTLVAGIPTAALEPINESRNAPATCGFTLPVSEQTASDIMDASSDEIELHVFRDGLLMFAGPVINIDADGSMMTGHAIEPWWYFDRRVVGDLSEPPNILPEPDFSRPPLFMAASDSPLTLQDNRWCYTRQFQIHPVPFFRPPLASDIDHNNTTVVLPGAGSSMQMNGPAVYDTDGIPLLVQLVTFDSVAYDRRAVLSAWIYVDSLTDDTWHGTGISLNLMPERSTWKQNNWFSIYTENDLDYWTTSMVRSNDRHGEWRLLACAVDVPANYSGIYKVMLWSGPGVQYFSSPSLVIEDLVSTNGDLSDNISALVTHAQDVTVGKSDLNITVDSPDLGVPGDWVYSYFRHDNIGRTLASFASNGWCEYRMRQTVAPATATRELVVDVADTVQWKPSLGFRLGADGRGNAESAHSDRMRSTSSNSVAAQGRTVGPWREQAHAQDADAYGGLILEEVVKAGDQVYGPALQTFADRYLSVSVAEQIVKIDCSPGDRRVTGLQVSDTTTLAVDFGGLKVDAFASDVDDYGGVHTATDPTRWRVVSKSVRPADDQATFTFNVQQFGAVTIPDPQPTIHGLVGWAHSWDASELYVGDVETWESGTSSAVLTADTTFPTASRTSGANGTPGVTFDGVDDFMETSTFAADIPTGSTQVAIVQVLETVPLTGNNLIVGSGATSKRQEIWVLSSGNDYSLYSGSFGTATSDVTNDHTAIFAKYGTSAELYIDGTDYPISSSGTSKMDTLRLGGGQTAYFTRLNYVVTAVGIYDGDVRDDPGWDDLVTHVSDVYGLSLEP